VRLFLNSRFILLLIVINSVAIFLNGFNFSNSANDLFLRIDILITVLFVIEIIVKMKHYGIKGYFKSKWHIFDFLLILMSLPSLLTFLFGAEVLNISFVLVFRITRIFKSFRFLIFVPDIDRLVKGAKRALRASVFVLITFLVYIFVSSMVSFHLFKNVSPDFADPLISLYSTFKVFTIEGWYDIPEQIVNNYGEVGTFLTHSYFIFILLTGGIFGLSLVNSIFVDAMVSDNNDKLEDKVDRLEKKIDKLLEK